MKSYKCIKKLILLSLMIFLLVGCSGESDDDGTNNGYYIYYLSNEDNSITRELVEVKVDDEKNITNLARNVIEVMLNPEDREKYSSVINSNVKIIDYNIIDNVITINFTSNYNEQKKSAELMCRAGFVLTLTQIEGIDFVGINVNGQPLMINKGASLMKASDFSDVSPDSILDESDTEINLYFANENGDKLKSVKRSIKYDGSETLEKIIVKELIAGPKEEGFLRTLPKDVNLTDAYTWNGTCYVYFDTSINAPIVGVSDELVVYSIVDSLSELTYINKVQIIIDGAPNNKLHEAYALDSAFTRNLDIVESIVDENVNN